MSASSTPKDGGGEGEAFLLRDLTAGAVGGGIVAVANEDSTGFASALAVNRADLRLAIVKFAAGSTLQGVASECTIFNDEGVEYTAKRMRGTEQENVMRAVAFHRYRRAKRRTSSRDGETQRLCSQ